MENNNINNTKRRNFLRLSAIGGFFGFLTGFMPFKLGKPQAKKSESAAKIIVKSHPLAIKRNK